MIAPEKCTRTSMQNHITFVGYRYYTMQKITAFQVLFLASNINSLLDIFQKKNYLLDER